MAREEYLRRTNISKNSLNDEWVGKGSFDHLNKERTVMYICPECGHHAFSLAPKSGWFHCWACGIWGKMNEGLAVNGERLAVNGERLAVRGEGLATRGSHNTQHVAHSTSHVAHSTKSSSLLSDYVSLSKDVLAKIEDISMAETVSGAQFNVREYLKQQNIPLEIAHSMRVGVASRQIKSKEDDKGQERSCIVYRNYVDGFCCNAKYRAVKSKAFEQSSAFTPCAPYNIDCLNPKRNEGVEKLTLYITEGEKDCLTMQILGFVHVISAANGAQTDHDKSFEAFRDWLKPVRTVVIVGDQDQPGRKMVESLTDYFANKQVKVAQWDQRYLGKDISDVYQEKGEDVARELVLSAETVRREDIEDYLTEEAQMLTIESSRGNYDKGYDVGIGPLTNQHFRLSSSGGLAIFTGTPGTGKTDFLNFLTMSLLNQRRSHVCYCSFETPNKYRHAGDLTQIWAGASDLSTMTTEEVRPYAETVMRHISHIILRREKPTPEAVLKKAEAILDLHPQTEFLVIDPYLYMSLTEGRNISETDSIKTMLTTLQDWAHIHKIWIFIVAHPRKLKKDDGTNELEEIDYYTIAGSANWANIADFVVSLKRVLKSNCDYTRMSVLKVRDQKICVPGDVYYNRQTCARYDERATEADAIAGKGAQNVDAWELISD